MEKRKSSKGFYETVRKTLFACRIAGYLPIIGLLNENSKLSRCIWVSKYTIYHGISLLMLFGFSYFHIHHILVSTKLYYGALIFRIFGMVSSVFLMRFCMRWEKMIEDVENIERLLPPFKNLERIIKNINYGMLFILILCIANQVIYLVYTWRVTMFCYINNNVLSFETYSTMYYKWLFDRISFDYITAFALQISKLQMLFVYYYTDFLVIVVTIYLVYRFRNFNRLMRIRQASCSRNRNVVWMDLQAHYTRLARLVKTVDDYINLFVFLSFLSNLIFICTYFYDIIQKLKKISSNAENPSCNIAHSFDHIIILDRAVKNIILIIRISAVSILTAYLHTISREPLNLLHTLPDLAYTPEVQRFMDQVFHSKIWLTGFGFFHVSMDTVLAVLGSALTYELVLLKPPVAL